MNDNIYAIWLSLKITPGAKLSNRILSAFNSSYKAIFDADRDEYIEKLYNDASVSSQSKIDNSLIDSLCDKSLDNAYEISDYCARQNIGIVTVSSPLYPSRLKRISAMPLILYFKGRFPDFDNNCAIATVGTRRITDYGKRNAYAISRDLARGGAIVVSGMARGIDTVCHRGALDAGGFTVAVLGCGIDVTYPPENLSLMNEIAHKGTVITEFAPGTEPHGYNFPIRNRIISGLSCGTLVVEADDKSGAIITAKYAQAQGRDIFAVPGNVGEINSRGTISLIKDGATMVTSALDILSEYEYIYPDSIRIENILLSQNRYGVSQRGVFKVAATSIPIPKKDENSSDEHTGSIPEEPFTKKKRARKNESCKKKEPSKKESSKEKKKDAETPLSKTENSPSPVLPENLSDTEKSVLSAIPEGKAVTSDEISRASIPINTVLIALTTLEIKGLVKALPGGLYKKA